MHARARGDRGGVTANVAILPTVFTLFFLIIQISLWFHGRSVATAAAHHALEAARVRNGTAGEGQAAGRDFVDQVGGLKGITITVNRGAQTVTVEVDADALTVVPGFQKHINVDLEAPIEQVTP
jgi:hypothetical protein